MNALNVYSYHGLKSRKISGKVSELLMEIKRPFLGWHLLDYNFKNISEFFYIYFTNLVYTLNQVSLFSGVFLQTPILTFCLNPYKTTLKHSFGFYHKQYLGCGSQLNIFNIYPNKRNYVLYF